MLHTFFIIVISEYLVCGGSALTYEERERRGQENRQGRKDKEVPGTNSEVTTKNIPRRNTCTYYICCITYCITWLTPTSGVYMLNLVYSSNYFITCHI